MAAGGCYWPVCMSMYASHRHTLERCLGMYILLSCFEVGWLVVQANRNKAHTTLWWLLKVHYVVSLPLFYSRCGTHCKHRMFAQQTHTMFWDTIFIVVHTCSTDSGPEWEQEAFACIPAEGKKIQQQQTITTLWVMLRLCRVFPRNCITITLSWHKREKYLCAPLHLYTPHSTP